MTLTARSILLTSAAVMSLTAAVPTAQTFVIPPGARSAPPDPNVPLYFEAASVKRNTEGGLNTSINRQPGGRFITINTPVTLLVTFAYQLQPYQLLGAPDWARDERYDLVAKYDGDPPPVNPADGAGHMMLALRTLLADRFALKIRRETREMDIYQLVMARPGGKPGPALKPAGDECRQPAGAAPGGPPAGPPPLRPDGTPVFCGFRQQPNRFQLNGMALSQFANGVAQRVGRQVVDRTGLAGEWSFDIMFTPPAGGPPPPPGVELPPVDPTLPDLFTALQEHLGLKLESVKGQVPVVVVESVSRPTED